MTKVLVLYYSSYGHIETMAKAVAEGARSAGAEVSIKRVPELVPEEVAKASHFKLDQGLVRRTLGDMTPNKAQLLVLRYSGLSYQEIAEILDVAPTSIGPLLFRAEKDFARRYREMNPEEADDAPE